MSYLHKQLDCRTDSLRYGVLVDVFEVFLCSSKRRREACLAHCTLEGRHTFITRNFRRQTLRPRMAATRTSFNLPFLASLHACIHVQASKAAQQQPRSRDYIKRRRTSPHAPCRSLGTSWSSSAAWQKRSRSPPPPRLRRVCPPACPVPGTGLGSEKRRISGFEDHRFLLLPTPSNAQQHLMAAHGTTKERGHARACFTSQASMRGQVMVRRFV